MYLYNYEVTFLRQYDSMLILFCARKKSSMSMTQKMGQQTGMFLVSKSTILHTNYMKNTSTKHAYKKMHAKIHEKKCANFWKLSVKSY